MDWGQCSSLRFACMAPTFWSQDWTFPQISSVGAGIDSFLEYALKWYILSGEHEFLDVWNESYAAVMRYSRSLDGLWVSLHSRFVTVSLTHRSIDRYI